MKTLRLNTRSLLDMLKTMSEGVRHCDELLEDLIEEVEDILLGFETGNFDDDDVDRIYEIMKDWDWDFV